MRASTRSWRSVRPCSGCPDVLTLDISSGKRPHKPIGWRAAGHYMGPKWGQRAGPTDVTRLNARPPSSLTSANKVHSSASPSEKPKVAGSIPALATRCLCWSRCFSSTLASSDTGCSRIYGARFGPMQNAPVRRFSLRASVASFDRDVCTGRVARRLRVRDVRSSGRGAEGRPGSTGASRWCRCIYERKRWNCRAVAEVLWRTPRSTDLVHRLGPRGRCRWQLNTNGAARPSTPNRIQALDVFGQTGAAVLRQTDDVRVCRRVRAGAGCLGPTIPESSQPQGPSLLMTRGHSWTAEVEGRAPVVRWGHERLIGCRTDESFH